MPPPGRWTAVCKDFVDPANTRCQARPARGRHHDFPEGHAYILRDADGHEHPFGLACAREALADPGELAHIPDYTVRDVRPAFAESETAPPQGRSRRAVLSAAQLHAIAARYLVLRMEKVAAVPRVQPTVRFPPLEDLYVQYRQGATLDPQQVRRILAIERSPTTPPRLRHTNLLDVYTAHVKLERLIAESTSLSTIRFLRSLHDWLARHLVLSSGQLEAAGIAMHAQAFRSPGVWAGREGGNGEAKGSSGQLF